MPKQENEKTSHKNDFIAGVLEEVSDYLGDDPRNPAAGIKLGANISALARRFEGDILDSVLKRGSKRLAEKAAERRSQNLSDSDSDD
jgi:hypothetical protein